MKVLKVVDKIMIVLFLVALVFGIGSSINESMTYSKPFLFNIDEGESTTITLDSELEYVVKFESMVYVDEENSDCILSKDTINDSIICDCFSPNMGGRIVFNLKITSEDNNYYLVKDKDSFFDTSDNWDIAEVNLPKGIYTFSIIGEPENSSYNQLYFTHSTRNENQSIIFMSLIIAFLLAGLLILSSTYRFLVSKDSNVIKSLFKRRLIKRSEVMRSRESFNEAAELYDEVRPSYPDELIDWIIEKTDLRVTDNLLEIAPATGQCTRKFAERDFTVHSVELGDKLAELLLENMKTYNVTCDVSAFEDWVPNNNDKYKLIYCATAWHWIDPKVKYKKAFDLLEENGRLAIIWNNALGNVDNTIMDKAYDLLFSYHKESAFSTKPRTVEEIKARNLGTKGMLEDSGHFLLDDQFEKTWSFMQPKEKVIKGFYSQSSFLSLNKEDKEELVFKLSKVFKKMDDNVETSFKSVVYLLKKKTNE